MKTDCATKKDSGSSGGLEQDRTGEPARGVIAGVVGKTEAARMLGTTPDEVTWWAEDGRIDHYRYHGGDEDGQKGPPLLFLVSDLLDEQGTNGTDGRDQDNPCRSGCEDVSPSGRNTPSECGGGKSRPPRLWTENYCPNCGKEGIEFLSFSAFAEKPDTPHRSTVSRRVRKATYVADATRRVPWCKQCKDRTPQGRGVPQPEGKPHVDDYAPDEAFTENVRQWVAECVSEVFYSFERWWVDNPELASSPSEKCYYPAVESYEEALRAVLEKAKEKSRDLSKEEVEKIARPVVEKTKQKEAFHYYQFRADEGRTEAIQERW